MIRVDPILAHEDNRGTIEDLLVRPIDSVSRILTLKDEVRGNHYHQETFQWTYVLDGQLLVITRDPSDGLRQRSFLNPDQLMCSPPGEHHVWRAVVDTTVLVFTRGPRSGASYESDTFRLEGNDRLIVT